MPALTADTYTPALPTMKELPENHQDSEASIVARVANLPVVALTLSRLNEAYQRTKLRNELLKAALEKGEGTVLASWEIAADIANKTGLQRPLHLADSSACYILDKVEERLPIIAYTPTEIRDNTRRLYDDKVQPRIDQLTSIKDSTVRKYHDAKEYGSSKLLEAKSLGTTTVKTVLQAPVSTVSNSLGWGINTADHLVDRLLPDTRHTNGHSSDHLEDNGNLEHVKAVSEKLRSRLAARIADNNQTAQLLAQAIQIVDALKHTSAVTSLNQLWENLQRISGSSPLGEVSLSNIEHQTLTLVKNLTAQLKEALEGSRQQLTAYLPQPLTDKVHQVSDAARDIFLQVSEARSVDDLSHTLIDQVGGYVNQVQTTMNSALDVLTDTYLLKWLVPQYQNIGSLDIHMH